MATKSFEINPYVYNIKGDWRADKSFAYLTGRNFQASANNNPRDIGFFQTFSLFYRLDQGQWIRNTAGWTSASQVTKYHPSGMELENQDALLRFQSAQYGYHSKLPMAVAANSAYREMFFEGFEEWSGNDRARFTKPLPGESLTATEAHSGQKSIRVGPGESVTLAKKLKDPVPITAPKFDDCDEPSTSNDVPRCAPAVSTVSPDETGYYHFSIPVNFGSDLPNPGNPVTICNNVNNGFSYFGGTITYHSQTAPQTTYIIIRDGNGDCKRFVLIPILSPLDDLGPAPVTIQVHGCVQVCECF
ncbi:MAG TPA: hypothetical protein VGB50_11740 [Flavobacterium sp.]|jgi:hypothetical protein